MSKMNTELIKLMAQADDLVYGLIISEVYKGVMHQLETHTAEFKHYMDESCSYDDDPHHRWALNDPDHFRSDGYYQDELSHMVRGYDHQEFCEAFEYMCFIIDNVIRHGLDKRKLEDDLTREALRSPLFKILLREAVVGDN